MRKSKLDNPHIKQEVIQRLAIGESQGSIAKDVGLHQSQISRFVNRDDVKPFIEKEQLRLLEALPDAVDNVKGLVREMPKIPKKDTKRRELSYKASLDVMKSAGIMPTPEKSQAIINIFQQTNIIPSPLVQAILEEHMRKLNSFGKEDQREMSEINQKDEDNLGDN